MDLSRRRMDGPHQRGLVMHLSGTVASPGSVRDTAVEGHSCQGNINAGAVLDKRCTHERGYAHVAWTLDLSLMVLARADFIVVTAPSTSETEGMIGKRELALMKKRWVDDFVTMAMGAGRRGLRR
jgi:D-isomer specific 2-hydroxyacid dehydrogenase-like protein